MKPIEFLNKLKVEGYVNDYQIKNKKDCHPSCVVKVFEEQDILKLSGEFISKEQIKKKILNWCWKNNTIPAKAFGLKNSNLHLATLDGGWVNVLKLQKFLEDVLE